MYRVPSRFSLKLIASLSLFLASAPILSAEQITPTQTNPQAKKIPEAKIYTIQKNNLSMTTTLGGSVIPSKMVNLSAQLPGAVQFIAGQEGDYFTRGTDLVALNSATLLAKRRQAVAQLNSANAGVNNAYVQYRREVLSPNSQANSMLAGMPSMMTMMTDPVRSMAGQSDPDYERHSALYGQSIQIQTAKNQVKQAQAGIEELDENLKKAISVAPFDGTIVKKMIQVGDIIQPGMPLLVFADTSLMQVQVEVPTKLISSIKEGNGLKVLLADYSGLIDGRISRIFPMANMGGHTTTVKIDLPQGIKAKAGLYAEVFIPTSTQNSSRPTIPVSAISWRGSLPSVFLVGPKSTHLKMKTIRLGKRVNDQAVVLSGLNIGDKILLSPSTTTHSGAY